MPRLPGSRRLGLCLMALVGIAGLVGCGGDGGGSSAKDSGVDTKVTGSGGRGTGGATGTGGDLGTGSGGTGTGGSGTGGTGTGGTGTGGANPGTGGAAGGSGTGGVAGSTATGGAATGGHVGGNGGNAGMGGRGGAGGMGGTSVSCMVATTCPAPAVGTGTAACTNNVCTVNCAAGYHRCGEGCLINTDINSCGNRCTACPAPTAGGSATCEGTPRTCGVTCTTGYHECPGAGDSRTCVMNGSTSPMSCGNNCTVCTQPMNGRVDCSTNGMCIPTCNAGFHLCGTGPTATCVPNNNLNVNSCGNSCAVCATTANGTATCTAATAGGAATCGIQCQSGYHTCPNGSNSICVQNNSPRSGCSLNGCQACVDPSGGGDSMCASTGCVQTCPAGRHLCSGACVLNTADATCGASCTPCGAGMTCTGPATNAQCTLSCAANTHRCGTLTTGSCEPNTSVVACGTGDGTCTQCTDSLANGHPVCNAGVCGNTCDDAYCRSTPTSACVAHDNAHCGAGCTPCPGATTITNGAVTCPVGTAGASMCMVMCNANFHQCGGTTTANPPTCKANTDPVACGMDCMVCPIPTNATAATCTAGACGFTCAPTHHRCGNACILNSPTNTMCGGSSGACTACPTNQVCTVDNTGCMAPPTN